MGFGYDGKSMLSFRKGVKESGESDKEVVNEDKSVVGRDEKTRNLVDDIISTILIGKPVNECGTIRDFIRKVGNQEGTYRINSFLDKLSDEQETAIIYRFVMALKNGTLKYKHIKMKNVAPIDYFLVELEVLRRSVYFEHIKLRLKEKGENFTSFCSPDEPIAKTEGELRRREKIRECIKEIFGYTNC